MRNTIQVHIKPCDRDYSGSYCFPCVSGMCPYNADFMRDCYPGLGYEMQELFEELFSLRMNSKRGHQILMVQH